MWCLAIIEPRVVACSCLLPFKGRIKGSSLLPFKGRIEVGMVLIATGRQNYTIPIPAFPLKGKETTSHDGGA